MNLCQSLTDVVQSIKRDGIEYVRFEASNCNGQSFGKVVPVRHIQSVFEKGLPMCCSVWFMTASSGVTTECNKAKELNFRNVFLFPYAETYTVLPYCKTTKIARILTHPHMDNTCKEIWPCDPRTICLKQLAQLQSLGFELYSAFEHEFQVINKATNKHLWSGKEYGSHNKFAENEDFACSIDKYLYKMGIDIEYMHVEYSPAQYEMPMKPDWGINAADNSFTFRNSIKQIAHQHNYLATFATKPFPANKDDSSNGAHFNFSLWTDSGDTMDEKEGNEDDEIIYLSDDDEKNGDTKCKRNTNAFYDEKTENKLSQTAMYFIGGIIEHVNALTIFANATPNCFRRSNTHSWSPGNVSWGRNNRSVMIRVKTNGESGTYLEYRLSGAACNPYMVMTSVIAAGIDGIKNKIKPKYKECVKDAWNEEYQHLPKILENMKEAIKALKEDKVIWNAFGDTFCTIFTQTKALEVKELEALAETQGREKAETNMFLNI